MFLNQLSNEEKNAFVNLSIKIAEANGIFDEVEKEMVQAYCKEMEITFANIEKAGDMEAIVEVFKSSSDHVKRIVVLEALGLAYSDGKLDPEEEVLMKDFVEKIGVDENAYEEIATLLNKYNAVLEELVEKI